MTRPHRPKQLTLVQRATEIKSIEPQALIQLLLAPHLRVIDALYIHTPFCFHKCHYCDFYSIVDDDRDSGRQMRFVERLVKELELRCKQVDIRPQTIFVGGGTPTLLSVECWRVLLDALKRFGVLDGLVEFTVEANPETVTPQLMELLVSRGVNRISVGCQSFQPDLLKTLERWHDPASVPRAVQMIRAAGITNFNLDLIFGIPGESLDMLQDDLAKALSLSPTHLSCYGLTYEPNTAMTQRLKMNQFKPMDEDVERGMYAQIIHTLAGEGFEHYEVSNWGKRVPASAPGAAARSQSCLHNLMYWTNRNWLGIGPSAASHIDGHRWKNAAHLGRYMESSDEPPVMDYEHLPQDRTIGERLMLGLRLIQGIELVWVAQHVPPGSARARQIEYLKTIGMLQEAGAHLRLTTKGLFVADAVIRELL